MPLQSVADGDYSKVIEKDTLCQNTRTFRKECLLWNRS